MASLRDPLLGLDNAPSAEWQAAAAEAARPNSLRGGWESGRINTERNALAIDEFAARANGDIQRADTLRMQNEALGQAQARVAPEVGRVEDIKGVGDALNWAGGVIGQGAASMVDPVAAATALGGVGRVAGMLPGTAGKVGRAIGTIGGPLAAYGINQRQMAGEFANTAMQDRELMARTTPQERLDMANMYGGVAGLADTALPGIIGHQLTGGALRNGVKTVAAGMGPAAKTGLGMLGEGFTEYGQGKGSQYAQSLLNPNRDTSGDASDDLNNALGGAIGGGPLIAAGAYADTGYRRLGQTADAVGTKAGETVDLLKEKYDGSAMQQGVDKVLGAGKKKIGDLVDLARDENGQINLAKLAEGARDNVEQAVERYKLSAEERSILSGDVPADIVDDPAKYTQWMVENDGKRISFVAERLNDMLETDPRAEELFDRLTGTEDPVEQATVAEEAAKYILENNELEQLATRGQRAAAAFGELASKGATALGKGAVVAGKAAMGFGKAVFDGAAAEARKKNAQGAPDTSYDAWKKRRDEMRGGALPIEDQVERHQVGNRALDREAIKNDPATAAAKLRSRRRAELFGEILEAEARSARAVFATRADPAVEDAFGLITRHAGYELADIAESWGMKGPKQQGGFGLAAGTRQTPVLTMALDRIANSLRVALRDRATSALDQLQAQSDAGAAPLFDYVRERITSAGTPAGRKAMEAVRTNVANELMMLLPDARRAEIMRGEAAGGKLSRTWLLESVEALANGHESPKFRAALDEAFGKAVVDEMIGRLNTAGVAPAKLMKGTVDDGGVQGEAGVNDDGEYEAEQATDFDKRQAEKTVAKGSGPKVYGFARTQGQSLRGSTDRRDPFAPITKMTAKEKEAYEETNKRRAAEGLEPLAGAPVKRPGLFKLDDTLFDGTNALEKKLADLSEATKKTGHAVSAQSAFDVMKGLNFQPAKILSVYRDYMLQDAGDENLSAGERMAARTAAGVANRAVLDTMDQKDGKSAGLRLGAGEHKKITQAAEAYFKERYVAVAEKLSDAVPNRIELTELLSMGRAGAKAVKYARGQDDMQYQVLDEANLITFQSDLLKNKDRGLHIKADTLVNWVRTQRERTEESGDEDGQSSKNANQAYLDDLMEGIAAVVDSGMVDEKMPTRINAKGEYEAFITDPKTVERERQDGSTVAVPVYPKSSPNGIPASLRLATKYYWQLEQERDERSDVRRPDPLDPQSSRYQNAVRRDQNRNEEFYVADPLEGTAPEPTISRAQGQTMTAEEEAQFAALNTAKERREFLSNLGLKQSGEQFSDARAADAKTKGDKAAPLDFFPKQKAGAVPDEFADQQFRSKSGPSVYDPLPVEHMMSAPGKAKDRAGPIIQALRGEIGTQEEGLNMIVSRIKAAETASTKNGVAGGLQYLYPAAAALQPGLVDAIGTFKGSVPEMDSHLKMLRGQIFRILRDGVPKADWNTGKVSIEPVSMRHQLAITKLLMGKHADKVTAQTVKDVIAKRAAESETGLDYFPMSKTPELKDISQKPLRPMAREDGKSTGIRERGEATLPDSAVRRTRKYADQFDGDVDEMMKAIKLKENARNKAAREVAATQAPKSQSKPSGVDLGAKGPYAAKDQAKSDQATKFIGRGSPASSTAKYAAAWGDRANTGNYTASDRIFVSAEGDRAGRVGPDFRELKKATSAGATIITDSKADRERAYNVGEREVAEFLQAQGYSEVAPGVWSPGVVVASRLGIIADAAGAKTDPAVAKAANELITLASGAWEQGTDKKEFLASEAARRALTVLAARKLVGAPRAQEAIDAVMAIVDQIYGVAQDRVLLNKVRARLVETMMSKQPVMLADILADYATSRLPAGVKAIARAVQKVAGDTAVRAGSKKAVGGEGVYNASTDLIEVALAAHNPLHTVLHEGVHAATLSAVVKDAELHKALYSLMAHAVAHDPALQQAYGFSNTLEFLAEGLSNSGLQRRLYKIPANKTVEKYLGATIANAWDAFTALVRKALNLPAEHQSVLTQLLDLSGRAMKAVGQSPDRLTSAGEHASAADRALVPQKTVEHLRKQLNDLPALSKETRKLVSDQFSSDGSSHFDALLLTALVKELTSKPAPDGSITPNALRGISSELASALEHAVFPNKIGAADWSDTGARKLSAMSTEIHNDLQRGGFAATHDSPIRHEGKFNWRAYTGMGEGNAAFGAGTYLSTGDKVHAFYKKMMSNKTEQLRDLVQSVIGTGPVTAEGKAYALEEARNKVAEYKRLLAESVYPPDAQEYRQGIEEWSQIERQISRAKIGVPFDMETKSPTYHVSVGIMKAQLLNWDKPLSEQSSFVQRKLREVGFEASRGEIESLEWTHDDSIETSTAQTPNGIQVVISTDFGFGGFDVFVGGSLVGNAKNFKLAERLALDTLAGDQNPTGATIYKDLTQRLGSQAAASDYLQSLGILGHEYAASNGRDNKTPNYVIYDDSKITTNYVHFNRQGGNSRVATQAEMDEAKAYVRKVLGPQIKVEFKDITGYSGEWLDAEQAIEISTTAAAGALSTAYHEALHGFFSKFVKNDPRALDTLKSLAENEKILQRVAALLANHPAAIDQLKSGEERLAYIYQFWAAGKLDLPIGKPRTLLQKVRKFFRRVLGLVRDSERAVALFEAFHAGQLAEPSAAGKVIAKVLDEGTGVLKARRKLDGLTQWLAAKTMPAETVLATSESKAAQALAKEFFTNPGDEDAGGEAEGYLNARRRVALRYNNTFAQAVNGLTDRDMTEVAKYLQGEAELADIPYAPHREAVAKIRGLLQRFYKYMSDERGLKLGHAGEKYYPRVWNTTLLHEKKDQFIQMLTTHYDSVLEQGAAGSKGKLSKEQVAERIWRALIDREGVNDKLDAQRQDGVLAPFFASKENRTLAWLQGEHAEPFLEKNLVATLSRYFHQGVRAAEYNERFGENGELLEARLREIMGELNELSVKKMQRKEFKDDDARAKWVSRQYRDISEAVGAMEGTLGKDISPGWRKANSWMTVYQNVRLLPLSLFASFVDPLGMVARGATMREAYEAFLRGMKEVTASWGDMFREEPKERQADKWEKLAEHIGAVDAALFAHHVSDEYSSVYMERGAKKINDTLFKLNGMEAWNRGMRVAGVKSAVAFIERHSALPDKAHSARWLKELGLDPANIPLDADGQLITDKNVLMAVKGVGKAQAAREIDAIHYAINRWVEGAILTPNAAQRPAWGSDPHYSMFFHLKQFSYSFHQTILKRAVKEMNHGNLAPMGAFVWYIPTMIAADVVKGLVQGGGELPAYMKGYDLGDWVMHGAQRAGVLGAGQLGVDAAEDVFSLAGPGVEQAIDAMRDPLKDTAIKAAPLHGLYAQALR